MENVKINGGSYGGFRFRIENENQYFIPSENDIILYDIEESEIEKIINLLNKYRIPTEYEIHIQAIIADIKSKDFKLTTIDSFNSILNLKPGTFEDYYIPAVKQEIVIGIK